MPAPMAPPAHHEPVRTPATVQPLSPANAPATAPVPAMRPRPAAAPASVPTENQQHRRLIRDELFEQIDPQKAAGMARDKLQTQIDALIRRICDDHRLQLSRQEEDLISQQMLDEMIGSGPIEPLLADESINDILVNGARQVFVERHGKLELTSITFIDEEHVFNTAQRIAARIGRRIDEANPMVDARLPDGSRVNVITHPLALDGTTISIRKFMRRDLSLESMAQRGAMSMDMAVLLRRAMEAKLNIVVSGGTGAGKTTLLNALSQKISREERIVTIEDAAELQLQQIHVVRLETRPASAEGTGRIDQRDLMRNALRMRPDRIIIGEMRDGAAALETLKSWNTGHPGGLSTVHANSAEGALRRVEDLIGEVTSQVSCRMIGEAVDCVVHIRRTSSGRRVEAVLDVSGYADGAYQIRALA